MRFEEVSPSVDNYWRSIILFGQNVASYKFALAKSLLEVAQTGKRTTVTLEELAIPYAKHLTEHLKLSDKQSTSKSSKFLDICREYNSGGISHEKLINKTTKLGFNNVIDAFHVVNREEIPSRFYIDERYTATRSIRLTDTLYRLLENYQHRNLPHEIEARWRLVETAWQLDISKNLISYDNQDGLLFTETSLTKRKNITSCRHALNGYQKGKCFYCFDDISITKGADGLTHVDHFFPHTLKQFLEFEPALVDGVWNLVLACSDCNLNKLARVPCIDYLRRLNTRNEFLIESHHPLRETLIRQTGISKDARQAFLRDWDKKAISRLIHRWKNTYEYSPVF